MMTHRNRKAKAKAGDDEKDEVPKIKETKFLENVIRNSNWCTSMDLAERSTRAFVAEVIPGAHEYLKWFEDPEFGTRVVRVILTGSCDEGLRRDALDGLIMAEKDNFIPDVVVLPPSNVTIYQWSDKGTGPQENKLLAAINCVQSELYRTNHR